MLNGEAHEIERLRPDTTLLQLLRGPHSLTGTKEGCAEGDCGACTVLGRLRADRLIWQPVNACILLLPMADKSVIRTVEGVAKEEDATPGSTGDGRQSRLTMRFLYTRFCDVVIWWLAEQILF